MKRVMCSWFPGWPIQRLGAAQPELEKRPLVLFRPARGKMVVAACSGSAARRGVAVGMPLAEAKSFLAAAHFQLHDARADREALRELAVACQQFSPLVALEELEQPESLLMDVSGCAPLFGGEQALADKAAEELGLRGLRPRIAIANTIGAAWAVAHGLTGSAGRPRPQRDFPRPIVVPHGDETRVLKPLGVECLRLPLDKLRLLHAFDLRRIGQLMDLPRAALPARFGLEVLQRLDQALGTVPELLIREPLPRPVEADWSFEWPTADRSILGATFAHLLERVLEQLRSRPVGIQQLLCSLRLTNRERISFSVGLLQASVASGHMMELIRLHFERIRISAEVASIALRVTGIAPLEYRQRALFEGDAADRWKPPSLLMERLSSRLGEAAVLRARLVPDAQPEFAWRYEPCVRQEGKAGEARFALGSKKALLRPLCLKPRPLAIAVMVPGGLPLRITWRERSYDVAQAWGPERIETGWWRGADVRRDYYLVETTGGERFWLFRSIEDQTWFLHGIFV